MVGWHLRRWCYNATAQMVGGMGKSAASGITLGLVNEVLVQEDEESEAVYRILVALGNLVGILV